MFPSIAEYNQVIQSNSVGTFRTLTNLSFIPSRTIPFRIYSYGAGSYAVVFKAKDQLNNEFAIRCFTNAEQENIDRYRSIDNYLKGVSASWLTKIEFLENEICVKGNYYPVVKMEWVEGEVLDNYISQNLDDNLVLTSLQNEVVNVSKSLENFKIGHGDVQCANIIITKNILGENIIKLIDYDGMFIPLFLNKTNLERGKTDFQHPKRSQFQFNEKVDRFSFWVILCAIEALKYDRTLWLRVMQGGFYTEANLLFLGDDFENFNNSKLVSRLYLLNKPSLNFYLDKLNKFCNSSPDNIELPFLFESIISNTQTAEIHPEIGTQNIDKIIQIITEPTGAEVLSSLFQKIGNTPLEIDKEKYINKTLIISYGTQTKQVQILDYTKKIDLTFLEIKPFEKSIAPIIQENPYHNIQNTPIESPIIPTSKYKTSKSRRIIFEIIAIIIVAVLIIVSTFRSQLLSLSNSNVFTSSNSEFDKVKKNVTIISDSSKDENGLTAKETVNYFLESLSNNNCDAAWAKIYNITWEKKGKDWFCSSEQFGGITKKKPYVIVITQVSQIGNKSEVVVEYTREDFKNGFRCFKQKITVNMLKISNDKLQWFIINIEDIEPPIQCD